jgi:hypothetical protein
LGEKVKRTENDDEQGDHRDESGMMAGEGFFEGDETGDEQRDGGAASGDGDGERSEGEGGYSGERDGV